MISQHAFGLHRGPWPGEPVVLPTPKSLKMGAGAPFVLTRETRLIAFTEGSGTAAELLSQRVFDLAGFRPRVCIGTVDNEEPNVLMACGDPMKPRCTYGENVCPVHPESYTVIVDDHAIILAGEDAAGLHWAVHTLLQLMYSESGQVFIPACSVSDQPDMSYRGLFVECSWGSDLMELGDWKNCVDVLSELKLNSLGIGLYGCWGVQYRREITQFLMTPIEGRPELRTPREIGWYSPAAASWQEISYLPRMFEQDFLGEVVRYAKERQVTVWPYFNSLGHNRLLVQAYPETSSKNLDGSPKGSDFCTSNPATYELLFDCYDQIIERYLRPNGVDRFHIQMDEVSNWCRCPDCRDVPTHELYIRHLVKLANHLVGKGINLIGVWNDILLHDKSVTDLLLSELDRNGLKDKLIWQWYMYGHQVWDSFKPELGLRSLAAPMTGFQHNYLSAYHVSHFQNIYQMLKLGARDGSEGAEPYGIYDYGYHRYYCCLSEFAWNTPAADGDEASDIAAFQDKYVRRFYPNKSKEMSAALDAIHQAYTMPLANDRTVLHGISHYEWSCPPPPDYAKIPYPEAPLKRLKSDPDHLAKLPKAAALLESARKAFETLALDDVEIPLIAQNLRAECGRLSALAESFLDLPAIDQSFQTLKACVEADPARAWSLYEDIRARAEKIRAVQTEAMAEWEAFKADYQHPHNLRTMSLVLRFVEEMNARLEKIREALVEQNAAALPEEIILGTVADY